MKDISVDSLPGRARSGNRRRLLERLARRLVMQRLQALELGELHVIDGQHETVCGRRSEALDLAATVKVRDARFYGDVAFGGTIGAAEAFIHGFWTTDDLTAVVRILVANRGVLESLDSGSARLVQPLQSMLHRLNRNTRPGSRRNISAHYDLGNDFFSLWLDSRMMYSSAIFEREDMSLDEAAEAKLDRICRKLGLCGDDNVVEIGSGWGGFAMHAASHYGCRVTTTTISREQYTFATERVRQAGLEDRVTVLFEDYRDLQGCYDKLVSIEMIEAVGHRYFATFFDKCCRLLKPDGLMCLQAITIADQRFDQASRSVDFIQRYIFPGGCLPSLTSMAKAVTLHTDMLITHVEDFGPHYARTLNAWRQRFFAALADVRRLGYSDEFIRLWQYYLCYCEGAFTERAIGAVQLLLMRPGNRRPPTLGQLD